MVGAVVIGCGFAFFSTDTPTTEIYTLSLHDALPISAAARRRGAAAPAEAVSARRLDPRRRAGPESERGATDRVQAAALHRGRAVALRARRLRDAGPAGLDQARRLGPREGRHRRRPAGLRPG